MKVQSKYLESVVEEFSFFPGIGKKSALRMALHLLNQSEEKRKGLEMAVANLQHIRRCKVCYNLCDKELCTICVDEGRRKSVVCVVEDIQDIMAIEETGQYNGLYHVLGGVISPIEGVGPEDVRVDELVNRIEEKAVSEIIMAISPTIDGETTIYYISKKLEHLSVSISQIARGVSFGGELQYTDELTLGRSILARVPYVLNGHL